MADAEHVVREYWQRIWVDGDLDSLAEFVADPTVRHTNDGTRELTIDGLRSRISDALRTICGSRVRIDAIRVDDDEVWARITLEGTTLATMAPMTLTWMAQYRLENGKIAEMWALHQPGLDWNE